jgi:glutamyl-tRNA synthetase
LPLLIAPDGAKLSKRKHGPVGQRDDLSRCGIRAALVCELLCLLGWNPKDNREQMSRAELVEAFKLEGVNRSNAVVNFTEEDPIDPKALWLNGQTIRTMPVDELAALLLPYVQAAGWTVDEAKMRAVTPLVQERIRVLPEVTAVADLFFVEQLAPYDPAELVPQKGDAAMAERVLSKAAEALADAEFTHAGLESSLREAASRVGVKAGADVLPIRVAVCGRKTAPPLFETLEVPRTGD